MRNQFSYTFLFTALNVLKPKVNHLIYFYFAVMQCKIKIYTQHMQTYIQIDERERKMVIVVFVE